MMVTLKDITLNGARRYQFCTVLDNMNLALLIKFMGKRADQCQPCTIYE